MTCRGARWHGAVKDQSSVVKGGCATIEFEALPWEKVAFYGADASNSRIRNLRWDQRIAFNIGWSIRGYPLWLVTDDRDFARAAAAVGHGDRVLPTTSDGWEAVGSRPLCNFSVAAVSAANGAHDASGNEKARRHATSRRYASLDPILGRAFNP